MSKIGLKKNGWEWVGGVSSIQNVWNFPNFARANVNYMSMFLCFEPQDLTEHVASRILMELIANICAA